MKRTAVVLLAVTLLLATAAPASAKKPKPDPDPPPTVEISFVFNGENPGLDSTCAPKPLVAEQDVAGNGAVAYLLIEKSEADASEIMDIDLDLFGTFGDAIMPAGVCDFGTNPASPIQPTANSGVLEPGGLLFISFDRKGNLDDFMWHFDFIVGEDEASATKKGKPEQTRPPRVIHRLTLGAVDGLDWTNVGPTGTGVVTGTFGLHLYENGEHSNYGVADLAFIMTIEATP
jgi:hypothetical protein